MTPIDIAALANAAGEETDHTKAPAVKDFDREVPVAGKGLMRLREYIELGEHPCASKMYPDKKPSRKVRLVFELCHPKHIQTITQEGKEDIIIPHVLATTITMPTKGAAHAKSAYAKLFAKLNYDGKLKHPAQALGRAFIVNIIAGYDAEDMDGNKPKEGAKPKYANFKDADGGFLIEPPRVEDVMSGVITEVPVPELRGALKIFLYGTPSKETFDSLFIDGTYKNKEDKEVSKNWLQETILSALDFEGSPLQCLLVGGVADALDGLPVGEVTKVVSKPQDTGIADPLAGFDL